MLHRLMRRAIFAKADRIMCQHMNNALAHQCRKPHRGAEVIAKDQEGAAIGDDAAMQRHAIHGRRHAMFAHAPMHEATAEIAGRNRRHALHIGVVGPREVRRTANHFQHGWHQGFQRLLAGNAGCELWLICRDLGAQRGKRLIPGFRQAARHGAFEFRALRVLGDALQPGTPRARAAPPGIFPKCLDIRRHFKGRRSPAERLLGGGSFSGTEWRTMAARCPRLGRCAEANDGPAGNQRRFPVTHGPGHGGGQFARIMPIHASHGPAIGLEALQHIFRK